MFKDFGRRLQRDIKKLVDTRLEAAMQKIGQKGDVAKVDVNVVSHHMFVLILWHIYLLSQLTTIAQK